MALFRQAAKLAAASGTATLAPQLATVIGGTCSALPSLCHLFSSSGNPAFFVRRSSSAAAAPLSEDDQRKAAVGRLLYRAKQRGFLEMDLLVGLWAQANVPRMDPAHLAAFEVVLNQENPDLFKWITGQEEPPADMAANPAFADLRKHVAAQLEQHRSNQAMTRPGREWVRGWDDWNKPPEPVPQQKA